MTSSTQEHQTQLPRRDLVQSPTVTLLFARHVLLFLNTHGNSILVVERR